MLPEGMGSWIRRSSLRPLPAWIILWETSHPSESPDIFKTDWEFLSLEWFGHEEIIQLPWLDLLKVLLHKLSLPQWTWRREMLEFSFFSCPGLCPCLPRGSFFSSPTSLTPHKAQGAEGRASGRSWRGRNSLNQSPPASCGRQRRCLGG